MNRTFTLCFSLYPIALPFGYVLIYTFYHYAVPDANSNIANLEPVVLWTGKENTKGTILSLRDDITKYRYIDVYINYSGNLAIQTFDLSVADYYDSKGFNITNGAGTSLTFCECRIDKKSNTSLILQESSWNTWEWNGEITSSPVKRTDITQNSAPYVHKIVGRMV